MVPGEPDAHVDLQDIRDRLVRSVRRVCPPWLRSRSEDIVQDALVRVLESERLGESNPPVPSSYLWKVAYSATVDEIRRLKRRPEVSWEDADPEGVDPQDPGSPEADRALHELGEATEACLGTLPDARRTVVGFHLMGYGAQEIARMFDWGEKTVRNLLHRGLVALRDCLRGKGFEA
jgi:RNA polymerase sigma-70 factor (ECF subfamily)